jgi:hypothetical protein
MELFVLTSGRGDDHGGDEGGDGGTKRNGDEEEE